MKLLAGSFGVAGMGVWMISVKALFLGETHAAIYLAISGIFFELLAIVAVQVYKE